MSESVIELRFVAAKSDCWWCNKGAGSKGCSDDNLTE